MNEFSKFVGLDVHKATIAVAVADKAGGEPRFFGEMIGHTAEVRAVASMCWSSPCTRLMLAFMAEVGDLTRFSSAPQLMAYLGLVPSESSSGPTKRRGGITKTGNSHVRRVLVEAAWTYRHPARKTRTLQCRAEKTSDTAQALAWKAQQRLCARYWALDARGKLKVQTCTAVARELAGFIWAIGQAVPGPNNPAA